MAQRFRSVIVLALGALLGASCTVKQTEAPSLTGPSEFGLSVTVTASPDSISQDGASQSVVAVTALDPSGRPVPSIALRLDMQVGGQLQDYGQLSARTIVTGNDGRATTAYTAPPAPPATAGGGGTIVSILATPTGTNFQTAVARSVAIRLVPPGVILPPAGTPTASFIFTPTPVSMNVPVTFDASASYDNSGPIASYAWTFGDGSTGSGKTASHTYSTPGTFAVTLTVTNARGIPASTSQSVNVGTTAAPVASFVFSPTAPAVGQNVVFNADASRAAAGHRIVQYSWIFGDGSGGDGFTANHAFAAVGTYSVSLSVLDEVGQKGTISQSVTVAAVTGSPAPTAAFVFSPTAPSIGQTVFFNAASSAAAAGRTIASYGWDFGDGNTGSGVAPTHGYAAAGTYSVTLTVTDDASKTGTVTRTLTVSTVPPGTPPTASFVFSPTAPTAGTSVSFNAAASTGTSPLTYAWDFGEGAGFGATSGTPTTSHLFSNSGTFTVSLRVTDGNVPAQTATTSKTVTVTTASGTPPTASFTFSPTAPGVGETVTFNASSSSGTGALTYAWDFGEGLGFTATSLTPTHNFATAGTYTVTLKVTDSAVPPQSSTTSKTVTVGAPPAPTARFTSSPTAPVVGQDVVFDASTSVTSQGQTITSYAWDFGDGTAPITCSTGSALPCFTGNPRIISHQYAAPGTYVVNLIVTDSTSPVGRTASTSASVTVASANPTARLAVTNTGGLTVSGNGSASTAVGSAVITNYAFVWGDGASDLVNSAPVLSHSYGVLGTYTVTLTVTDNLGHTSNLVTATVTVP